MPPSSIDLSTRIGAPAPRRQLLLGAAAAAAFAITGCSRSAPVRLGFLGGISGRSADLGIGGRNGAQLAVDVLNEAGGIDGRKVELIVRDDEHNDDVSRKRMEELADTGVALVIGPMTSAMAVAILPVADRRGLVCISPTVTSHELGGKADHFFRVVPDATRGAAQQADYLAARGLRTLSIVADHANRAFSQSWSQVAQRRFAERGGSTVLELTFATGPGLAYGDLADKLAGSGADVVLVIANAADSAVLLQQVRRRNPQVQLATSSWAGTEQLLQLVGGAVDGAIVPQYFDRGSRAPEFLRFAERYRQRFGEAPGYPSVKSYDATMLGAEAIRRQRGPESVRDVLRSIRSHSGLQQPIELDEFGDCAAQMFLTRIESGQFVTVGKT